jgi:hypothetical protein
VGDSVPDGNLDLARTLTLDEIVDQHVGTLDVGAHQCAVERQGFRARTRLGREALAVEFGLVQ